MIKKTKLCTKCNEYKDLSEFSPDSSRIDGYRYNCKPCTNEINAAYNKRNATKLKEYQAAYYLRRKKGNG